MESSCSWSTSSVVRGHHVYKNVWTPLLANDYSYADRIMNDHAVSVVKAEAIVGHVPREMSCTFWHFIMHGGSVGCEIMGWRTLVGCEITGRRTLGKGGGADKRGGAHSRYQFFRCGKIGGGGGGGGDKRWGRSDGTPRYMHTHTHALTCTLHTYTCTHTHSHLHTSTFTHAHSHTYMHTHARTHIPYCLAVTPPLPIFGRKYCIGLFYLHYTPLPVGRSSRFAVLQFLHVYVCCKCRRVVFVYQACRKLFENWSWPFSLISDGFLRPSSCCRGWWEESDCETICQKMAMYVYVAFSTATACRSKEFSSSSSQQSFIDLSTQIRGGA